MCEWVRLGKLSSPVMCGFWELIGQIQATRFDCRHVYLPSLLVAPEILFLKARKSTTYLEELFLITVTKNVMSSVLLDRGMYEA